MKIINIDADEYICSKVLEYFDFIDNILAPQRNKLMEINRINLLKYNHKDNNEQLPKVRMFEVFDYANVANLIHTIPIYLTKTQSESIRHDALGSYVTSQTNPEPRIELYIETIDNECHNKYGRVEDDDFKYLFMLTLLHELGHAALDVNNCSWHAIPFDDVTYSADKNREEGMANAIAYRIIQDSKIGDGFLDYAKEFIDGQGYGYKEGINLSDELEKNITDFIRWKIETLDNKTTKKQ